MRTSAIVEINAGSHAVSQFGEAMGAMPTPVLRGGHAESTRSMATAQDRCGHGTLPNNQLRG
jgi:hypothetical protein